MTLHSNFWSYCPMTLDRNTFFINNEWVSPASSRTFEIVGASTGEIIATAPEAVEADIDRAVAAARSAHLSGEWADASPVQRATIMRRFIASIGARADDIARLVSIQNGMPISLSSQLEAQFPLGVLEYYAGLAETLGSPDVRPSQVGRETLVESSPVGVVAAIVPWNFPVALAISKIAPALAAGCTLVLKASPGTILDSYALAEAALEAGIPAGVLNWVAADREVGAYLVGHPGVDKVAFTGSTGAGRIVAARCGQLLRPVTLELGGKSASILLEDADLDQFIKGMPMTSMLNNGQACFNGTRVLVPVSRYAEVVDAMAAAMSSLVIGDALDPLTEVGPMASAVHRDRVESYIRTGSDEARLVSGGGRPQKLDRGWFVEPTLFADVDNRMTIAREEIFGPVLAVIKYDGDEEAIRIANDSDFGLGGSVWGSDRERALSVARAVNSGTVGINGYMPSLGSPFGGIKASGLGREFGPDAISAYQQIKSIYVMG
jgi:geranial dehydrogenase